MRIRRNKKEMTLMRYECTYYLLQTENDPQKAFDMMIDDIIRNKNNFPYYINGIEDFEKVAKEIENSVDF